MTDTRLRREACKLEYEEKYVDSYQSHRETERRQLHSSDSPRTKKPLHPNTVNGAAFKMSRMSRAIQIQMKDRSISIPMNEPIQRFAEDDHSMHSIQSKPIDTIQSIGRSY